MRKLPGCRFGGRLQALVVAKQSHRPRRQRNLCAMTYEDDAIKAHARFVEPFQAIRDPFLIIFKQIEIFTESCCLSYFFNHTSNQITPLLPASHKRKWGRCFYSLISDSMVSQKKDAVSWYECHFLICLLDDHLLLLDQCPGLLVTKYRRCPRQLSKVRQILSAHSK